MGGNNRRKKYYKKSTTDQIEKKNVRGGTCLVLIIP
jgi:hypothetical protein